MLFTAVALAVLIPRSVGSHVAGTAKPIPIQRPPTVGQCILDNPSANGGGFGRVTALHYGSCSRPHYGEIVQVFAESDTFPHIQGGQPAAPDPSACTSAADSYLSVDQVLPRFDRGDYRSVSFGSWQPVSVGLVGLIGPNVTQQLVGQQWIACVTKGSTDAPYLGTVRGAFVGGTLPNSYTLCTDQLRGGDPVDCAGPHSTELFADTGIVGALPSQASLTASCSSFVQYLTARPDLLTDGRVRVETTTSFYGEPAKPSAGQTKSGQSRLAQAFCGVSVAGPGKLTATLFGIRDQPLPLS